MVDTNLIDSSKLKRGLKDFIRFPTKVTPVDNDILLIEDSADNYKKKKVLKSALGGGAGVPGGADTQIQFNNNGIFDGTSSAVIDNQGVVTLLKANIGSFQLQQVAATGGNVTYANGYTIHSFLNSGTFTVTAGGNIEYLVVAGGGGGGGENVGGGGGAGGVLQGINMPIAAQAYPVTVGIGGAGGAAGQQHAGTNGGDSVFGGLTAIGGGGGHHGVPPDNGGAALNGSNGGSGGGGGGCDSGTAGAGGIGTTGQGNNGGNGCINNPGAGGGGGAGGVGVSAVAGTGVGGAGGIGTQSSITGTAQYYAGGGGGGGNSGGGTGGLGGGGNGSFGAYPTAGGNGAINTGGGGGGMGGNDRHINPGGNGGSGIVIVRYQTNVTTPAKFTVNQTSEANIVDFQKNGSAYLSVLPTGKLAVKTGSNQGMGTATLVAGSVVVSNILVTNNSNIFLTRQTMGGTLGHLYISSKTAGVEFVLTSTSNTETSQVFWWIIEPI